jgi:hypothetical protein
VKRGDKLEVISTANQDSPYHGSAFPVIGLTCGACVLPKYQNCRPITSTPGGTSSIGKSPMTASAGPEENREDTKQKRAAKRHLLMVSLRVTPSASRLYFDATEHFAANQNCCIASIDDESGDSVWCICDRIGFCDAERPGPISEELIAEIASQSLRRSRRFC